MGRSGEREECNSLFCESYSSDYCPRCSHYMLWGSGKDSTGKVWRWTFNPRFGPLFETKDGEPLVNQPIRENHPAWEPFLRWQEERAI